MKFISKFTAVVLVLSLMSGACFAAVSSLDDLKNAKTGVQAGSVAETLMIDMLGGKTENLSSYENVAALVDALKAKTIDAAVMDEAPARYYIMNDETLNVLPQPLESDFYAIAFRKGSPLCDEVNKILEEMLNDGTLANIIAKYLGEDPDPAEIDMNTGAEGGKLWVGCAASFPPYEVRTDRGFAGIDIEICAAIAKKLNKELVIADYRFDILPEALAEGKIDMICSAMIITEERQKIMDFSTPYDANQEVVVVLK